MRYRKTFMLTAIVFFSTLTLGFGADVAKIGVVDFQKILTNSSAGKKAQLEINEKGKAMEEELKSKGDSIKEQKESFERESLVMSKEMREQKERELRIMVNDFRTLQKRYMDEFKTYEKRIVAQIRNDILNLVDDLAKSGGYLLVLERREGGLLYFPTTLDLTDEIIKLYNAQIAAEQGKSKP